MQKMRNHTIDFLFPVALFFVFAVSALSVLLMAASVYRSVTENSSRNDTARTTLAYLNEKLHQNDTDGSISLSSFDGRDALLISRGDGEETYLTYIYVDDKELKELFVKEGVDASASDGKKITSVEDFSMEEPEKGVFRFTCTDESGQSVSSIVSVKSVP